MTITSTFLDVFRCIESRAGPWDIALSVKQKVTKVCLRDVCHRFQAIIDLVPFLTIHSRYKGKLSIQARLTGNIYTPRNAVDVVMPSSNVASK